MSVALVQLREISILDTTFLEGLTPCSDISDPKELVGKLLYVPKNFFTIECACPLTLPDARTRPIVPASACVTHCEARCEACVFRPLRAVSSLTIMSRSGVSWRVT